MAGLREQINSDLSKLMMRDTNEAMAWGADRPEPGQRCRDEGVSGPLPSPLASKLWPSGRKRHRGFSLIEVLCVMAIILILVSLMLPAFARALRKARGLGDHLGGPGGVQMRIDEVINNYTRYRAANPNHGKLSKRAFVSQLQLSPAAETWLNLNSVEYRPFAAADPTQQLAIVVFPSPGSGSGDKLEYFRIGDLIRP